MATLHYTARAKDSRTLELPEEARALGMQPGDIVDVFVTQHEDATPVTLSEDEEQERVRALTTRLFAEADATKRKPGTYSDPQKAAVADMIADKHRKMQSSV